MSTNIHIRHVNNITRFETVVICAAFWAVLTCLLSCSPHIQHQSGEVVRTKYWRVRLIAPHTRHGQLFWYAVNVETGERLEWLPDGDVKRYNKK